MGIEQDDDSPERLIIAVYERLTEQHIHLLYKTIKWGIVAFTVIAVSVIVAFMPAS